jgi:hypothetical protein
MNCSVETEYQMNLEAKLELKLEFLFYLIIYS